MFAVNKKARTFVEHNFIAIRNEFTNDGLITNKIESSFYGYEQLEKLYFQALTRNVRNRVITIEIYINSNNFAIFNEVFRWIKDQ